MASPEWGFKEMKEPRCQVTWVSLSKVWACPTGQHPFPSSATADASLCPPSDPAGTVGGVAVPYLFLPEGQGSALRLYTKSALCWEPWSGVSAARDEDASGAEEEGLVERCRSL